MDSQNDLGIEVMMRISNTKASRTAAEREEYHRISALLDQALELTFPCSDPVAITFSGYDVFRPEAATAPAKESVRLSPDPKELRGRG